MDNKTQEAILLQLGVLTMQVSRLADRFEVATKNLADFEERFEEVVHVLEDDRRLDRIDGYE